MPEITGGGSEISRPYGDIFSDDALVAAGETLYDEGEKTVAEIATAMDGATTALAALEVSVYTDAFAASVFNHVNVTVARAALIFTHANLPAAKGATIIDHANLTAARATSIFDHANLTAAKAASIADSMTSAKMLTILNTGSLTDGDKIGALLDGTSLVAADAATHVNAGVYSTALYAEAFNSAQMAAAKANAIFDSANLTNANANTIAAALATGVTYTNFTNIEAVLTGTQLLADDVQTILYGIAFGARIVNILIGTAGDLTVAGATEISGVNRYGTVTVNGGITLTLAGQPAVLIVDTIANSGNIVKKLSGGAGGAAGGSSIADGGQGGGGYVIFTDVLGSSGILSADAENGINAVSTGTYGDGQNGGAGAFHRVAADVPGTGGNGGYNLITAMGSGGVNGAGGGGVDTDDREGGDGGGSALTTRASYAVQATEIAQAAIDWVINNIFLKAPSVSVSFPDAYGSGGGGGGTQPTIGTCGGGGGGGGEILTLCVTLNNTGTIRANGGGGGEKDAEDGMDNGGGGGGGGMVYIFYVSLTSAGTIQANGGSPGSSDNTAATAGGAGIATSQAV